MEINVLVRGFDKFTADLKKGERAARNLEPAYREVATNLRRAIGTEQFQSEGRARGTPWRRLDPRTIRARQRRYGFYKQPPRGTPRILHWLGTLRQSFESRMHPQHFERLTSNSLQWGSKFPPRPLREPSRPIIAFRNRAEEDKLITEVLEKHIMEALK